MSLIAFITVIAALLGGACGCASAGHGTTVSDASAAAKQDAAALNERQIQSILMSSCDEVIYAASDACTQVGRRTHRTESQLFCDTLRMGTALSAVSAATCPNARVGYADLLTLVTAQRMALEEPMARQSLDEVDRQLLHRTFTGFEERLWGRAGAALTPEEQAELRQMIVDWRKANPDRVGLASLRLHDFETARLGPMSGEGSAGGKDGSGLTVLRLLRIDPMEGLDPTLRQIQESRLLAERVAFWAQHAPTMFGWQVELSTSKLLNSDAARAVSQNGAQATKIAGEFSKSADRMATSYETTLKEIPKERAAAIEQADRVVATQVKATIAQSTAAIATERKAAIEQAGAEVAKRVQAVMEQASRDVDAQSKRSLDHAAAIVAAERRQTLVEAEATSQRLVDHLTARLLVVVAAGALIIAIVALAYRGIRHHSITVAAGRDTGVARPKLLHR